MKELILIYLKNNDVYICVREFNEFFEVLQLTLKDDRISYNDGITINFIGEPYNDRPLDLFDDDLDILFIKPVENLDDDLRHSITDKYYEKLEFYSYTNQII